MTASTSVPPVWEEYCPVERLLPGFRAAQVQLIGNSSLAGAYLALLDSGALDEISRIGSAIETVELNLEPQFESTYIDQLSLGN